MTKSLQTTNGIGDDIDLLSFRREESSQALSQRAIVLNHQNPLLWTRIAGPMTAQTATDNTVPVSGTVGYRISYVSPDGKIGPSSATVTISNPVK